MTRHPLEVVVPTLGAAPVGLQAPDFDLPCTNLDRGARGQVRLADYAGRWLLLLFYPRDFSFVCPTELTTFSSLAGEFARRRCSILGVGVDPVELHEEWIATAPDQGGLGPLQFPLASDRDGHAARDYGVYVDDKRVAGRGLFIIDPSGVLQYKVVHNLRVGRGTEEALRVLDALRVGGLCPSSWTLADGTIDPALVLSPGRVLGHYRIRRKLGEGGFGQVYEAWDMWLHRLVALKVLRPGRKVDRDRVLAEARPAAGLSHPNICTVYAVEEQDGLPVIAMEYLPGQSLAKRIRADGPLPRDEVRAVGRQVAAGMAASHSVGVVHGDLKPGNIMLSEDGGAKILDFGMARIAAVTQDGKAQPVAPARRSTGTNKGSIRFRGTPPYVNPEQAFGTPIIPASDVFTFGLVLYEMLTGHRALPTRSLRTAVRTVRKQTLAELARDVPRPFRKTVRACLQHLPTQRPTMAELATLLG